MHRRRMGRLLNPSSGPRRPCRRYRRPRAIICCPRCRRRCCSCRRNNFRRERRTIFPCISYRESRCVDASTHTFLFSLAFRPTLTCFLFLLLLMRHFLSFYRTCVYSLSLSSQPNFCFSFHAVLFFLFVFFFLLGLQLLFLLPSHFISSLHSSQDFTHAHVPLHHHPPVTVIIHRHQLTLLRYCS